MKNKIKIKLPRNPGRIPTAKGSIRHKSDKDYNRQNKDWCKDCYCTEYHTCDYHIKRGGKG